MSLHYFQFIVLFCSISSTNQPTNQPLNHAAASMTTLSSRDVTGSCDASAAAVIDISTVTCTARTTNNVRRRDSARCDIYRHAPRAPATRDAMTSPQSLLTLKDERVEELEEALRESVKITAQREMLVHELDLKVKKADIQVSRAHAASGMR